MAALQRTSHITIQRLTEVPLPVHIAGKLFHCPFCSETHFKPTRKDKVERHLKGHHNKAVVLEDMIIYRCGLGCKEMLHSHCPYCPRVNLRRDDFLNHIQKCKKRCSSALERAPPLPLSARAPPLSTPAAPASSLPVLSGPATAPPVSSPSTPASSLPVLSGPAAAPALSSPSTPASSLPVLSGPAATPPLSSPSTPASSLPVLSGPATAPPVSSPSTPASSLPVLSGPAAAPALSSPAAPASSLPVHSGPAATPALSSPAAPASSLPVLSGPATAPPLSSPSTPASTLPVLSGPAAAPAFATPASSLPVLSGPAAAPAFATPASSLPVLSGPATAPPLSSPSTPASSLPVLSGPAAAPAFATPASSLPVLSGPATAPPLSSPSTPASSLPVLSGPAATPALYSPAAPASSLPVRSGPATAPAFASPTSSLPVHSGPATAPAFASPASSLPVLSGPAATPALYSPAAPASSLPVRSGPAAAPAFASPASSLPVLSGPAGAPALYSPAAPASSLPVLSGPATSPPLSSPSTPASSLSVLPGPAAAPAFASPASSLPLFTGPAAAPPLKHQITTNTTPALATATPPPASDIKKTTATLTNSALEVTPAGPCPKKRVQLRTVIQKQCPFCEILINKCNLKRHIERKHAKEKIEDINARCYLPGEIIDKENGIYAILNLFQGHSIPVHVQLKTWGANHHLFCENSECRNNMDVAHQSGLCNYLCQHIRSATYTTSSAKHESLSPYVLDEMVTAKWFGQGAKKDCLKRQELAYNNKAPLSVHTNGIPETKKCISVYEPTISDYSCIGRVMVVYDTKMDKWTCPCTTLQRSCIHTYIAKWHLFQTQRNLFRTVCSTEEVMTENAEGEHDCSLEPKSEEDSCSVYTSKVELNPGLLPLDWLLGTWESDEPGEGCFPTIKPFRYTETLHFSHVEQSVINFMFNAFHAESKKPLHRECGFILMQPGTNRVAFTIAQDSGLVKIEVGELTGQQLNLQSQTLARISFAKDPQVQKITRVFQLRPDGRLEQTVSMATDIQPLIKHLHITYRRSS